MGTGVWFEQEAWEAGKQKDGLGIIHTGRVRSLWNHQGWDHAITEGTQQKSVG